MAWMDKYGEFRKQARAIRILGLVSSFFGVLTFAGNQLTGGEFIVFWVLAIHILGIVLISSGVQLRNEARVKKINMPIATRAIIFGWMMVTSFLWMPIIFGPLIL